MVQSLLNVWTQGLVQPLVSVDGPGYAWHLTSILLSLAILLLYHTVWVGPFQVGSSLGLRSGTQAHFSLFINCPLAHGIVMFCPAPYLTHIHCPIKHISPFSPLDLPGKYRFGPKAVSVFLLS